jgi:hypothetical protein
VVVVSSDPQGLKVGRGRRARTGLLTSIQRTFPAAPIAMMAILK